MNSTRTPRRAFALFAALLAASLTACATVPGVTVTESHPDEPTPTVTEPGPSDSEGELTVKDTPSGNPNDQITVASTDGIEDIAVQLWLDDSTAIVSKENRELEQYESFDGTKLYPRSLYTYDTSDKKLTPLIEEDGVSIEAYALNPDRTALIYAPYSVGDHTLKVLDLATHKTASLSFAWDAVWLDNYTIVGKFYGENHAFIADLSHGIDKVSPEKITGITDEVMYVHEAHNGKIYYTGADEHLKRYDTATEKTDSFGLTGVSALKVAPDEQQLALARYDSSEIAELAVCDINCTNPQSLAETDGQFAWSPDMRVLAYVVADGTSSGVYVHDFLSDSTTQVAVGSHYNKIAWNPTSEVLSLATYEDSDDRPETLLVHLAAPGE
ncbi:hypothetical protein ACFSYH_09010 [Populibacterium corticicola]|uniref:WD40 repeat domain-containing protein n=1 Tax=Populibacterium corticicola TaxID=1812826 RepID=A0ABW5XG37_9MICO